MSRQPRSVGLVLGTSTGGVGRHVRSLAGRFTAVGLRVVVAGPPGTEELFDFTAAGARFVPVRITRPGSQLPSAASVRRATAGLDLVHAHGLRAGLTGVLSGRRPLVVTLHNAVLAPGRLSTAGERLVDRRADVLLGVSPDLVDRARALGGRDVRFLPVAAPRIAPRRSPAEVRTELGIDAHRPLLLTVARLHPQKSLDVLIEAAARWRSMQPTPAVVIVGVGPLEAELSARIAASSAPVRLLGARNDVADLLAAADLAILPSAWEGWPLFLSEALQLGRPVVATSVGGVPELVGDAAVLVPPGDVAGLAAAVERLLADDAARATLAARALRRSEQLPTEDGTAAAVRSIYGELLAGDAGG